jgi:hypothetical protein
MYHIARNSGGIGWDVGTFAIVLQFFTHSNKQKYLAAYVYINKNISSVSKT